MEGSKFFEMTQDNGEIFEKIGFGKSILFKLKAQKLEILKIFELRKEKDGFFGCS